MLVDWTRGKNLIISSSANSINDIRGPHDVANLSSFLLGLSREQAKAAISRNCRFGLSLPQIPSFFASHTISRFFNFLFHCLCRAVITNALRKKHYKEAIRIDRISSDDQCNSEGAFFGDWKEWDPISSGEGDLPSLDDISNLFAAVSKLPKSTSAIDFSSANQFSLKDHLTTSGKNHVVGEKATSISRPEDVGSDAAAKLSSYNYDAMLDDRKSRADLPLGLQLSSCEGGKLSPSDMPRESANWQESAAAICNNEFLGSSIENDVASDSSGTPSPDIPLDNCTSMGKDKLLSAEFNLSSALRVDKMSTMCLEDVKFSYRTNVVSADIEIQKADSGVAESISCIAACLQSSNDIETSSTRSAQKVILEEQIKANAIEGEGKSEASSDGASLQICSVEPASSKEREGTRLSPDDVSFEDVPEVEMQEREVLIAGDTCVDEASVKVEDQKQQQSTVASGCASCPLKSGSSLIVFGNAF